MDNIEPRKAAAGSTWALATVVFWASSFPAIKIALVSFAPLELAALRFAIAALVLGGILIATRTAVLPRSRIGRVMASAIFGVFGYQALLNFGQQTVSAGAASFIVNTAPAITALLAIFILGEKFSARAWMGTGISFVGIAIIASAQPGGLRFGAGATLILGAACCMALYFIVQKPLVTAYGAMATTGAVVGAGALCLVPWLPGAFAQAQLASPQALIALVYLAVVPGALGYLTWGAAQKAIGAARAANFLYLVPPTAAAMAFVANGEVPGVALFGGGLLAIAGVALVNSRRT